MKLSTVGRYCPRRSMSLIILCGILLVVLIHHIMVGPGMRHGDIFARENIAHFEANMHKLKQDDPRLVEYIRRFWVRKPTTRPRKLSSPSTTDFSQYGQSYLVDDLLKRRKNGFFLEVGAGNGEDLSDTLFFERERDWSGLLVEANRELYTGIVHRRRKAYSINACASVTKHAVRSNFTHAGFVGGLTDHFDESHKRIMDLRPESLPRAVEMVEQCFPLFSMLVAVNRTHIDYFSLDVEGSELDILKTIPFDKVVIDIITVEYGVRGIKTRDESSIERLKAIRRFFKNLKGMYEEIGVIPSKFPDDQIENDVHGLDVIFKRKK
ncbi:hypothetical protein LSH36_278g06043 [Paralvinella palmiformis]|uniref:Methyltransferase FkbM domain-containing protein n=1 Tax=Paralvinella palmiformis TaxID=53620 RepID=A0AAD9JJB9_9ANNE|nr:hypothetical protein LSH36_278g06043 [Paralvinella palmiformis]